MIKNRYNEIIKKHDKRMREISDFEKSRKWSELYNHSVKLIEEVAKLEEENMKLRDKIDLIGSNL